MKKRLWWLTMVLIFLFTPLSLLIAAPLTTEITGKANEPITTVSAAVDKASHSDSASTSAPLSVETQYIHDRDRDRASQNQNESAGTYTAVLALLITVIVLLVYQYDKE